MNLPTTSESRPPDPDVGALILKSDFLAKTDPNTPADPRSMTTQWFPGLDPGDFLTHAPSGPVSYSIYPRDGEQWIGEVLHDNGLSVLARVSIDALRPDQVDGMYPGKLERPWYSGYKDSLVGTPAVALLVGGEWVAERLEWIKGNPDDWYSVRWLTSTKRILSSETLNRFKRGSQVANTPRPAPTTPDVEQESLSTSDGWGKRALPGRRARALRYLGGSSLFLESSPYELPLTQPAPMEPDEWQQIHDSIYRDDGVHSPPAGDETLSTIRALFPRSLIREVLLANPQLESQLRLAA